MRIFVVALLWATAMLFAASAPAIAHEKHKKDMAEQVQQPAAGDAHTSAAAQGSAMHTHMGEAMDEAERDRASMSFTKRLLDWLGRLHPTIVHFPIGFFPAALFTALVGRRRPTFGAPTQFLIVAAGMIAPIAAVLGWLNAMGADPGPLLTVHRWLGTGIGAAGLALAIWAWRRPDQVRGWGIIAALAVITAAIVAQSWYGGALVHGIEHLSW